MTFKMPIVSKDEMAQRFHQNWREQNPDDNCLPDGSVDDCLTNLNWLQNLNIMTKLGGTTPETPPASPIPSPEFSGKSLCGGEKSFMGSSVSHSKSKANASKAILEDVDYKTNGSVKPPYSYATLICMAMKANKNKMTLSSIYKWIKENFMYYKNADPSWQNSIRHNLSLNKCFIKIPRSKDEPGKGGFWRLDPKYAESLVDGIFKKRRPAQRQMGGGGTSKKSRKDKAKEARDLIPQVLEAFQQDTPPSSAESIISNGEIDLIAEMKSIPVVSSPSQQQFAYATVAAGICEYPTDVIISHNQNQTQQPHQRSQVHQQPQQQQQHIVHHQDDMIPPLEPIPHELAQAEIPHDHVGSSAADGSNPYGGAVCWNEVLEQDLELDSLYKYRPEDSISTVVNTALALNDDFFSSDGSSPDLPNELDLACPEQLDMGGGVSNGNNTIPSNDWWACFQHTPLDVALTPLLSISVPFNSNPQPTTMATSTNTTLNGNAMVANGVVNGLYTQNSMCPQGYGMVDNRQQQHHQQQQPQQHMQQQQSLGDGVHQQVWSECKSVLDVSGLDLDDLGDLDAVHAY